MEEESRSVGGDRQTCRAEGKRYATPVALDVTNRIDATPDALEATCKLVLCDRREPQLLVCWKRQTDSSCATEENRSSGCFRSYTTLDALDATDDVFV